MLILWCYCSTFRTVSEKVGTMGFETCGPNEAMVVSGCGYERPLLISGGRCWVWSGLQKVQRISLNVMTLNVDSPRVYTLHGVPISVTGIAQVKVSGALQ